MKLTQKQKVMAVLSDSYWHSNLELNQAVGWKFASRVSDLIREGHIIERMNGEGILYWYRLLEDAKAS